MSLAEIYVLHGYFWKSDENAASFLHAAGVGKSHLFIFGVQSGTLGSMSGTSVETSLIFLYI